MPIVEIANVPISQWNGRILMGTLRFAHPTFTRYPLRTGCYDWMYGRKIRVHESVDKNRPEIEVEGPVHIYILGGFNHAL